MSPKMAPKLQKMMECHSSWIFIQMMAKAAEVMPEVRGPLNLSSCF